ncbi:MAG: S24/S26 family peptidase [Porphyromonas sp.]|nr:S24/S26 family peptidase [Porphyromonas sp.]
MEGLQGPRVRSRAISNSVFFCELLEQIKLGKVVSIRAKGWSMLPLVWDDRDILHLAAPTERTVSVGRIILARMGDGRYVVHRIVAIEGNRVVMRGDGNPYQIEYLHRDKILGELVGVRRNGKEIKRGDFLWRAIGLLWPSNAFLRRVLLFAYRRLVVRPAATKPRRNL